MSVDQKLVVYAKPALPGEAVAWHACADPVLEARKIIELINENKTEMKLNIMITEDIRP
jgi:hypothetical protein